jgi:hypothetical protein
MTVHYIEAHGYQPPAEFIAAVLRSPLPDSEDYQVLTEPFWQLHHARYEELMRQHPAAGDADSESPSGAERGDARQQRP